jgi:tRNA-specific 2-thiouridylase
MCNKEIKFGLFFDKAMKLGFDYVATGHYARIMNGKIYAGKDANKDQSYFLAFIKPEILDRVMFPIGEYTKPEVRVMAKKFGLPNADRKDSQGICFVGKVNFAEFLKQYIPPKKGDIANKEGNVLGQHQGAFYYTIGQRKGLGLAGGPYFVVDKDMEKNIVVVSKEENDLLSKEVRIKNINWFDKPAGLEVSARVRYRQTAAPGIFSIDKNGKTGKLVFNTPQRAVTAGQLAVVYAGEQMLAGGIIE